MTLEPVRGSPPLVPDDCDAPSAAIVDVVTSSGAIDDVVEPSGPIDVDVVLVGGADEEVVSPPIEVVVVLVEDDVVELDVDVSGAIEVVVVDLVVVVVGLHCPPRSTDVWRVAWAPSFQVAATVSVRVPVTFPGTIVVADVDPLFPTVTLYPVTGKVVAPTLATADVIVMMCADSLLPIVQLTT